VVLLVVVADVQRDVGAAAAARRAALRRGRPTSAGVCARAKRFWRAQRRALLASSYPPPLSRARPP